MNNVFKSAVVFLLLFMYSFTSIGQDECGENSIFAAQYSYDIGKFGDCIDGLRSCLNRNGYKLPQKIDAYCLISKSYLAIDSVSEADRYIRLLLTLDDNFQPQSTDPNRFRLEVAYIRTLLRASLTSSVSKKSESIDMAPATMQVITAKDIQDRGYMDIESVFDDLPGFDISRDYGISYSVLYQRGYRSPALTERTMIMIDGVEDNDLWGNAAYISKQYPISNVKRIEVIYGPASTIYGANAFCGVINIVTKDEDDLVLGNTGERESKTKTVGVNLHTGVASNNTRFVDGTVGLSGKKVFFSVTGRAYYSDGVDLSSEPYWDGVTSYGDAAYTKRMSMPYSADSVARYVGDYFQVSSDGTKIVPTTAGIHRADSLDKALYKAASNNSGKYRDPIQDVYISAKLAFSHFKFGFQYWDKNEGAAGDFVDNFASINSALTNWQVRDYYIYARYDNKLSERINLSSFTYYRYCDFGDNSRVTTFSAYGNGGVNDYKFITGVMPSYARVNFYQASNVLRSELKSQYIINDKFDVLVGAEFTSGILQANYITTTLYPAVQYGRAIDSPGGNNFTTYTMSGYATGGYHNTKHKLNIDIGGRVDNNKFREKYGYGTVFNPRVDVIWYPGSCIFKAIYAEAFLNASNQNKFSTTGSRLLNNPALEPEKVKNIELSARYKLDKRSYVELAAYRGDYTHSLSLVNVKYGSSTTQQYADIGKSVVYGCQAASEIFIDKHLSVYANATYTVPQSIFTSVKGGDSSVRTGDIATFSGNGGVNIAFFRNKLNLNTRVNYVGEKPTGKNTSVTSSPFTKIDGHALLNMTLGYMVVKGILIQVGCNNIGDAKYYSPGMRTADGNVYAPRILQPGRNYMARLIFDLKG